MRVEAALDTGQTISPFYDSMLAKLIVHAATRDAARERLAQVLDDTVLLGFASNRAYLAACLRHSRFALGQASTAFIAEAGEELLTGADPDAPGVLAAAVYAWRATPAQGLTSRFPVPMRLELDGAIQDAILKPWETRVLRVVCAGKAHQLLVLRALCERGFAGCWCRTRGDPSGFFRIARPAGRGGAVARSPPCVARSDVGADALLRMLPADQPRSRHRWPGGWWPCMLLWGKWSTRAHPCWRSEAMKMEHAVLARGAGRVASLSIDPGAQVVLGQVLGQIEARMRAMTACVPVDHHHAGARAGGKNNDYNTGYKENHVLRSLNGPPPVPTVTNSVTG